jgi:hypothetical protein
MHQRKLRGAVNVFLGNGCGIRPRGQGSRRFDDGEIATNAIRLVLPRK